MADVDGTVLGEGDIVEIINMDDPAYKFLEGERGVVHHLPPEGGDTQAIVLLQRQDVPGLSTQQVWLRKVE